MQPYSRLAGKGETPAEVNGVHPTTVRAQTYKDIIMVQLTYNKLSSCSKFTMFGPQDAYTIVNFFFFLKELSSGNIAPRHLVITLKNGCTR